MFLQRGKSKGNYYLYLRAYANRENYSSKRVTVFSFGRVEVALQDMYRWRANFSEFPQELREICGKHELEDWIKTIETGITKTGRQYQAII